MLINQEYLSNIEPSKLFIYIFTELIFLRDSFLLS